MVGLDMFAGTSGGFRNSGCLVGGPYDTGILLFGVQGVPYFRKPPSTVVWRHDPLPSLQGFRLRVEHFLRLKALLTAKLLTCRRKATPVRHKSLHLSRTSVITSAARQSIP